MEEKSQKKNAQQLDIFARLASNKKVKKVFGEIPFEAKAALIDVSIKGRSKEDELFARDPFLRENVRRGLSYLKEQSTGAVICRRGLQKFFDLRHEYLDLLDGKSSYNISKDDQKLYKVIFEEAQGLIKRGGKVIVYKTEKANGENAQVSYCPKYDAWVIASKNVSILVRNEKDVEVYKKYGQERYSFAILIADVWFRLIKKINEKNVEELKKNLTGKTLIGEYCGNPLYQHLVEYKEITILFYALVDHLGDRTCLPISTFQEFVQRFQLPFVRMQPRKECTNLKDFIDILTELSKEVSENPLEKDEEGSVLYFEAVIEDRTEIISLCKLKTLEYRLYRKLREKLKAMIQKGYSTSEQMTRYIREVEDLCQVYKPPKPLEHYYEIARIAFNFVSANSNIAKKLGLRNRYLSFLKIIQECAKNNVVPQEAHFKELIEASALSEDSEKEDEAEDEGEEQEKEKEIKKDEKPKDGKKEKEKKRDSKEITNQIKEEVEKLAKAAVVEERKTGEKPQAKSTNVNTVELPKRVVIITPPLYFDMDQRRKLSETSGATSFKIDEWKEEISAEVKREIILLNKFPPSFKNIPLVQSNTVFLVAGFEEEGLKSALRKLEDLASQKGKFQSSGTEFMFITSKDKQKSLENLWKNFESFKESIHKILPNNYHILHLPKPDKIYNEIDMAFEKLSHFQATAQIENQQVQDGGSLETKVVEESKSNEPQKKAKGKILVFIPIGIPGMGKTTFLTILKKLLEEKGCSITIVSSDKIRKQHMEEAMRKNPSLSEKKAFDNSAKPAKQQFFDDVEKAILQTKGMGDSTHIIFLDKNHPPTIIRSTIEFFDKPKYQSKYEIKTVVLKPSCCKPFQSKSNATYPFSLTLLLTCIRRAFGRSNHETLQGDDVKVAGVILSFFNLYKDAKMTENYLRSEGANFSMELPFTHEDLEVEKSIPSTLVISLNNALQSAKDFNLDDEKVARFLGELSKLPEFKNPDPELLYQKSLENLNKCFQLFSNS